ncbi:MAG TPA: M3 family oligoendopeptidase [Tissierellia bacterium]|nr:M3 family oligoendopeptidase [Tissierellia bacterium]
MRWNLTDLYQSFDDPTLENDFNKLKQLLNELVEESSAEISQPKEYLEQTIRDLQELRRLSSRLGSFFSLTQSVESDHKGAADGLNRLRAFAGEQAIIDTRFKLFLKDLDLEALAKESALIKEHLFFLKELQTKANRLLSEKEEILLAKLRNTGSVAFSTLQGDIMSNLLIDVDLEGETKTLPLPAVRNLAYSGDPATRKAGFEAEIAAYPRIEKSSAAALNAIKGEVITVAEMIGFESPLEETIEDSRMDQQTLDALMEAIEAYLPHFRRYLKRKAEILGYDKGLPFYELFAPVGKSQLTYSYPEAMEFIIDTFKKVSPRLSDYVQLAYDKDWLDIEPRAGKRGGAFCSNLHVIGQSRIMSNFNGSFSNMTTLAHELGHGYHGLNLKDESILNAGYPMPIAETASIFNESLIVQEALKDVSADDALAILEDSISGANQVITDIYSRYLFETDLFEKRKTRTLQADELKEMMLEAQKKAYGDGLDPEILHPYMWINKPHYYSAGRSFYNFPYAFGLLMANGFIARYQAEGEAFMPKYDEFLRLTGQMSIPDVAATMGIDVRDSAFFKQSLEVIKGQIDEFIERTEELVQGDKND